MDFIYGNAVADFIAYIVFFYMQWVVLKMIYVSK